MIESVGRCPDNPPDVEGLVEAKDVIAAAVVARLLTTLNLRAAFPAPKLGLNAHSLVAPAVRAPPDLGDDAARARRAAVPIIDGDGRAVVSTTIDGDW